MPASSEMPKEVRMALLGKTASTAQALVDDLAHIRFLENTKELTAGDVRRLSASLRRILVEQDLKNVATPRVGRIHLRSARPSKEVQMGGASLHMLCGSDWRLHPQLGAFARSWPPSEGAFQGSLDPHQGGNSAWSGAGP